MAEQKVEVKLNCIVMTEVYTTASSTKGSETLISTDISIHNIYDFLCLYSNRITRKTGSVIWGK